MRKKFCCEDSRLLFEQYYRSQAGSGLPIFVGGRNQRGNGLGSMLSSLFRQAVPMLKRVGGQLFRSGAQVARDMLDGQSFSDSARKRASQGITTLLGEDPISEQTGSGRRRLRRGIKRKRKSSPIKRKKVTKRRAKKTKRRKNKYSKRDIFN